MSDEWTVLASWVDEIVSSCPKALQLEAQRLALNHAELVGFKSGAESIWSLFWTDGAVSPETHTGWRNHMILLRERWRSVFYEAATLQGALSRTGRGKTRHIDHEQDRMIAILATVYWASLGKEARKGGRRPSILRAAEAVGYWGKVRTKLQRHDLITILANDESWEMEACVEKVGHDGAALSVRKVYKRESIFHAGQMLEDGIQTRCVDGWWGVCRLADGHMIISGHSTEAAAIAQFRREQPRKVA